MLKVDRNGYFFFGESIKNGNFICAKPVNHGYIELTEMVDNYFSRIVCDSKEYLLSWLKDHGIEV